VLGPPETG